MGKDPGCAHPTKNGSGVLESGVSRVVSLAVASQSLVPILVQKTRKMFRLRYKFNWIS